MTKKDSEPIFSEVDIYYNYVFDIGRRVNPIDGARCLLSSDFGLKFQNYDTGKPELASVYGPWVEYYQKHSELLDSLKKLREETHIRNFFHAFRKAPVLFTKTILQSFLKSSDSEVNHSEPVNSEELYSQRLQNLIKTISADPLLALHENVDREIFSEGYLQKVPFTRVSLPVFSANIAGQAVDFDVTLTIHRSGIAILASYGIFSGDFSTDDLIGLQRFSKLPFEKCSIPSITVETYFRLFLGDSSRTWSHLEKQFPSEHQGCCGFEGGKEDMLLSIFEFYRYHVTEIIQGKKYHSIADLLGSLRNADWYGYPITFIKKIAPALKCGTDLKTKFRETVAKLIVGFDSPSPLKPEVIDYIYENDLSISDSYSLFLTEGAGTVIYYEDYSLHFPPDVPKNNQWIREKFLTTVVLDLLLLQKGIAATFAAQLREHTFDPVRLNRLKHEFFGAATDFETLGISHYGTVHDIVKRGQEILRINDRRRLFELNLENIESLIEVAESRHQRRRDRLVRTLTTIVATIFALNASESVIKVMVSWSHSLSDQYPWLIRQIYNEIINYVADHPVLSTLILYLTVVAVTLYATWYSTIISWRQRKKVLEDIPLKSSAKVISPFPIKFVSVDKVSNTPKKSSHGK